MSSPPSCRTLVAVEPDMQVEMGLVRRWKKGELTDLDLVQELARARQRQRVPSVEP